MTYSGDNVAIENRFASSWGSTTPVAYANVPFTPPNNSPFVRLTVLPGEANLAAIGAPFYRHAGIIDISIFVPEGKASKVAYDYAEQAAAIFRGAEFDGIQCRSVTLQSLGVRDGLFQLNLTIPYQRDTLFS